MALIKPSCVRDLRTRVNVVDVISGTVALKKAGNRFKGLCPFHQEKSPSFHVNPDMGVYKCFGCGKSGDIITFVRETEGLNFVEAVETVAKRFNVPLEYEEGRGPTQEERSLRQELFDLHELAAEHYHQVFRGASATGQFMRRYWTESRRFAPEIADDFKIGAAEPADHGLATALLKRKFSEDALRQCGLFFIRDNAILSAQTLRPRFRGRLMIPIRDHQGRVVAFTARQTELTPADDPAREAKYVNSPETPIFTKGNLLFNLDRARKAAGPGHPFVLVEGQLDALRAWSVGLKTAVAPQGTSITEGQLALLRRYHNEIDCLFDSDSAGQKATIRFFELAAREGLEIRMLTGSSGTKIDPDLFLLEGGIEAFKKLRTESLSSIKYLSLALLPKSRPPTEREKIAAVAKIAPLITVHTNQILKAAMISEIRTEFRLPSSLSDSAIEEAIILDAQSRGEVLPKTLYSTPTSPTLKIEVADISVEKYILSVLLHHELFGKPLSHALPHEWVDTTSIAGALLNRFLAEFEQDAWPGRDHLDALLETDEERALVSSLLFEPPNLDDPGKIVLEGLGQLRHRFLEPRLREIELALSNTQTDRQFDAFSLLKERSDLQRQLRQPVALNVVV